MKEKINKILVFGGLINFALYYFSSSRILFISLIFIFILLGVVNFEQVKKDIIENHYDNIVEEEELQAQIKKEQEEYAVIEEQRIQEARERLKAKREAEALRIQKERLAKEKNTK